MTSERKMAIRINDQITISSEQLLLGLIQHVLGEQQNLTLQESALFDLAEKPSPRLIASTRGLIAAGTDPLGDAFCLLRSPKERRQAGATYTPRAIVDAMIDWAVAENRSPVRVVDAGAGSGRFSIAASRAFPAAKILAVENDPLAALVLRANAKVLGFSDRLDVLVDDYRNLKLPSVKGATLFIGNPPYVRHHGISKEWKSWFSKAATSLGFSASALAGLHVHFFLKTSEIAKSGDFGAFITASEWMDVNYGSVLRKMLADGLGGASIHLINPNAKVFDDALTTGAITCFRVGNRPNQLIMHSVDNVLNLSLLDEGREVGWEELGSARKWSILTRGSPKPIGGMIELGELFRVHRGQVSGSNAVWIEGPANKGLPEQFLYPCVTRARDLIEAKEILADASKLRRVIDLPVDLNHVADEDSLAIEDFLKWAKDNKANEGWVASHRRAWWSVGLRAPAPILCTYMARSAPKFVRNPAKARHLNIAHGLYPVEPLSHDVLDFIAAYLRKNAGTEGGRTYAGGLVKFEPKEVERLHIPPPALASLGNS